MKPSEELRQLSYHPNLTDFPNFYKIIEEVEKQEQVLLGLLKKQNDWIEESRRLADIEKHRDLLMEELELIKPFFKYLIKEWY